MARGGRRAGAGRKPKPSAVVLGMNGRRIAALALPASPPEPIVDSEGLAEPPANLGLSAEAQIAWRTLALYALKERTLTASRLPGFAKLCEEWAYCAAFEQRLQQLGVTTAEADRLLKRLNDYKKLLRASLGDFNLKSFGKPAVQDKPKPKANPWASVAAK